MWRPVNVEYGATILQEIPRSQVSPICCNGKAAKVRCIPSGRRIPTSTAPCFLSHFGTCKSACFTSFNGQLSASHWSPNSWPLLTWFSAVEARSAKCCHIYCISIHRSCSVHVQLKHVFEIWVALQIWLLVRQLLEVCQLLPHGGMTASLFSKPLDYLDCHCRCIVLKFWTVYLLALMFLIVSYCFLNPLQTTSSHEIFVRKQLDSWGPAIWLPQTSFLSGFHRALDSSQSMAASQ